MTNEEKAKKLQEIHKVFVGLTVGEVTEILALAFGTLCLSKTDDKEVMVLFTEEFKRKIKASCLTAMYLLNRKKQDDIPEEK